MCKYACLWFALYQINQKVMISIILHCHIFLLPQLYAVWRESLEVQTLAKWQKKHQWRNKLWQIDDKSLIKRLLKTISCWTAVVCIFTGGLHLHIFLIKIPKALDACYLEY